MQVDFSADEVKVLMAVLNTVAVSPGPGQQSIETMRTLVVIHDKLATADEGPDTADSES